MAAAFARRGDVARETHRQKTCALDRRVFDGVMGSASKGKASSKCEEIPKEDLERIFARLEGKLAPEELALLRWIAKAHRYLLRLIKDPKVATGDIERLIS